MRVKQAVARLARILPLKKHLEELDNHAADIYRSVLSSFYDQGKAPGLNQLGEANKAVLEQLAQLDMITLDDAGEIRGCYPFTMEQRIHRIRINGFQVHAMCALDALAPAAMFECRAEVDSECEVSKAPVHIALDNQTVLNPDEVSGLHFGINWMAASGGCSCSDSLCTEMFFLKDSDIAQGWLEIDAENREIFDLDQAIAFSVGLFKPMMSKA